METQSINAVSSENPVLSDREVIFVTFYTKMQHPLSVIKVMDASKGEPFCIATNRFDLAAEKIIEIYRLRWQTEFFFKWIK
jgi:IS4 transposase